MKANIWLSGVIRPGLIEAGSPGPSPSSFARLSGVIRPGLIEAAEELRQQLGERLVIRGNSPRPH